MGSKLWVRLSAKVIKAAKRLVDPRNVTFHLLLAPVGAALCVVGVAAGAASTATQRRRASIRGGLQPYDGTNF